MPLWLLFSLIAAFLWGVGQVLSKKGLSHISPLWNNIFADVVGLFIYLPVVFFIGHATVIVPSFAILFLIFLSGVFYMSYFYAIEKGTLALTGTLFATYPIFTILLSQIFLHETITVVQTVGVMLTLFGGLIIAWPNKAETIHNFYWVFWGLLGAVLQGAGDFLSKVTENTVGVYNQAFWLIILFQLVSAGNYIFDKNGRKLPRFSLTKFMPSLLGTAMIVGGTLSLFFALQYGKVSLIAPVTSTYPALVVMLALIFLKEKINAKQIIGIAAILLGIVFVGMG